MLLVCVLCCILCNLSEVVLGLVHKFIGCFCVMKLKGAEI